MRSPVRRPVGAEGGNARGDRARSTIAHALIALIDGGNLRPTAAQIAARAKVSERSIYFHFGDAEIDRYLQLSADGIARPGSGSILTRCPRSFTGLTGMPQNARRGELSSLAI